MRDIKDEVAEADSLNDHDRTNDVIRKVPATTNVNEAVEALTSHINKYDVPDELEEQ